MLSLIKKSINAYCYKTKFYEILLKLKHYIEFCLHFWSKRAREALAFSRYTFALRSIKRMFLYFASSVGNQIEQTNRE